MNRYYRYLSDWWLTPYSRKFHFTTEIGILVGGNQEEPGGNLEEPGGNLKPVITKENHLCETGFFY